MHKNLISISLSLLSVLHAPPFIIYFNDMLQHNALMRYTHASVIKNELTMSCYKSKLHVKNNAVSHLPKKYIIYNI